jgi:Ca2+-binding RTX toxin-like protein
LTGGSGSDTLHGGIGDDTLCGCYGDDNLYGDEGSDSLDGEAGNDLTDGGPRVDTLLDTGGGLDSREVQDKGGTLSEYAYGGEYQAIDPTSGSGMADWTLSSFSSGPEKDPEVQR